MKMPIEPAAQPAADGGHSGNDTFLRDFYARIPAAIAAEFTDAQLMAIRMAYGARTRGAHWIDLRSSIPLFGKRIYLVLLLGAERRSRARRQRDRSAHPLVRLGNILAVALFAMMLTAALLGFLYLLKSLLGIDLVPGHSLGFWDATRQQLQFLFH